MGLNAGANSQGIYWKTGAAYNIPSDKRSGVGTWSDTRLASYLSTAQAEGRGGGVSALGAIS
jgi:hypothetical protein